MNAPLKLWNLGPSPNSKKVRLALGLKGVPFETVAVDPMDRAKIVEISGQPLTPVLTHGDTVVFDSGAILRYLDANVKGGPKLFSADYDEMKKIEVWEAWSKSDLAPHVSTIFGQYFAEKKDPSLVTKANAGLNAAAKRLEGDLGEGNWLVGGRPTAADICCASWFSLALLSPEAATSHPILGFFSESLKLDPERQKLRKWYQAIDQHDR